MSYTLSTGTFPSSSGRCSIAYSIYEPKGDVRAILQISHGMCEFIQRYENFAEFLSGKGFLVCGNDHLGHGATAPSQEELGYFAPENGWQFPVLDLHKLTEQMKSEHPGAPYFLLGHSMGSFLARMYLAEYGGELDGAILMGTSGGEALGKLGLRLCDIIIRHKGEYYRSRRLNQAMFGLYNSRIPDHQSEFDWITRDRDTVSEYEKNPRNNFVFTARGFRDLIRMLEEVSSEEWAGSVPKSLPILLASGEADPVGGYGKGVEKVFHQLAQAGCDAQMKLYAGARHELLNEINRQEVYRDIWHWLEQRLLEKKDRPAPDSSQDTESISKKK